MRVIVTQCVGMRTPGVEQPMWIATLFPYGAEVVSWESAQHAAAMARRDAEAIERHARETAEEAAEFLARWEDV